MRILKKGIVPKHKTKFKGQCEVCNCIVEAEQNEIKFTMTDAGGFYYVQCPTPECWATSIHIKLKL